ncbi:MAG: SUMF1/EgtB/PvdO family nonheme iron enzyme [Deltaproteobacteria bacterium]|nr:SUMF1/EgtB/PvdO family nonheme iron enzyme [Deltaproteobacteria bacterium]
MVWGFASLAAACGSASVLLDPSVPSDASLDRVVIGPTDVTSEFAGDADASDTRAPIDVVPDALADALDVTRTDVPTDTPTDSPDVATPPVDVFVPPCGALYEPCCAANRCSDPNTQCNTAGGYCAPCGGPGQRCCGSTCAAGTCAAGLCPRPSCPSASGPECTLVELPSATFTVAENIPGSEQRGITVNAFAMDAAEVTVARFRRYFPSISMRPPAPPPSVRYPGGTFLTEPMSPYPPQSPVWMAAPSAADAHPVRGVYHNAAQAFCIWDGGRLPTEAEWEFAAYGVADGRPRPRRYPWGNALPATTCDLANWNYCPGDDGQPTRRVAQFAANGGFYDLAGNVEELVADDFVPFSDAGCWGGIARRNPLCRTAEPTATRASVVRGGEYGITTPMPVPNDLPDATYRRRIRLSQSTFSQGFRCAYDR